MIPDIRALCTVHVHVCLALTEHFLHRAVTSLPTLRPWQWLVNIRWVQPVGGAPRGSFSWGGPRKEWESWHRPPLLASSTRSVDENIQCSILLNSQFHNAFNTIVNVWLYMYLAYTSLHPSTCSINNTVMYIWTSTNRSSPDRNTSTTDTYFASRNTRPYFLMSLL